LALAAHAAQWPVAAVQAPSAQQPASQAPPVLQAQSSPHFSQAHALAQHAGWSAECVLAQPATASDKAKAEAMNSERNNMMSFLA